MKVRIGIDTGQLVVTNLKVGGRIDRRARGVTITKAERVQKKADPNTVLITQDTLHVAKGYFEFENQGSHVLEGFSGKTHLHQVRESRGNLSPLEAAETIGLTLFIGRNTETKTLTEKWKEAQSGKKEIVEIFGEPGIGKSRLVKFLKDQAGNTDRIFECRCTQYSQNSALFPLTILLENKIHFQENDSAEKKYQKLSNWISPLNLSEPLASYLVAELLNIPKDSQPPSSERDEVEKLTPQRKRHLSLKVLGSIFKAQTTKGPLLFIAEDLHWADPSTLELIEMLVGLEKDTAILQCLTYRPEFHPSWRTKIETNLLMLDRLNQDQSEDFVTKVAGTNY